MIILELLFSFIIAAVLSSLLILIWRRSGKRTGLFWLFLTIFLSAWAGGVWMKPFGPQLWGINWFSFLFSALIVSLIFAAFAPQRPPKSRNETIKMLERIQREKELKKATYITLSSFFWGLLFVLIVAIIIRYL
jgi:hypothetical protein